MSKLKVAVIGCGSIARKRHIAEYAANSNVELAAFCDPVKERAEAYAAVHGGEVYTDYRDLLKNEHIAAVSVCTPNAYHAPISIAAAHAGKHVAKRAGFFKKPKRLSEQWEIWGFIRPT